MALLLSNYHHLSLSSKTHHHHYNHRHFLSPHPHKTLFLTKNPGKTLKCPNIRAALRETLPKSAIQRIADKLRTLGFVEEESNPQLGQANAQSDEIANPNPKIGEIFVPSSRQIPNFRVGHTLDPSWSSPHNPVPDVGLGGAIVRHHELRREVRREKREERERERGVEKEKVPTLAELSLSGSELRRLTTAGIRMKQKLNLGKAGITEGIVNGIHERWRRSEVVKIVCEDVCRLNMKRTHDLLERKTGGLVVWRAGSKIVLYRGVNYKYPYFSLDEASVNNNSQNVVKPDNGLLISEENLSLGRQAGESSRQNAPKPVDQPALVQGVGSPGRVRFLMPGEQQIVEEADQLLVGLGPRFTDWWGCDPLPVDADLLPAVVPRYRRPFRLLPFGVKPKLTNDEMTTLKRLGRPLPCHFALGRNRNLQGLAAAILKLWEKCEIAKIAVKRGVQNTNSQLMAEELKSLTGGILLSRDKEYIVFYRGKDFLPSVVSSAIEERRKSRIGGNRQLINGSSMIMAEDSVSISEGHASTAESGIGTVEKVRSSSQERKTRSIEATIERTSRKLSKALEEKTRAEKLLSELEQAQISQQAEVDKEGITEEERYMLRRVGLKMKPFLLLGRRGVFDGTVENMHLHWKYRELVKIICGGRNIQEIHSIARTLEAESGGILVAVERVRNGHAIIIYRGKNYQRPACLRPKTLLNKKEALKRSIEAQRRESLKLHVLKLARNVEDLQLKLVEDKHNLNARTDEQLDSQVAEHVTDQTMLDDVVGSLEGSSIERENLVGISSLYDEPSETAEKFDESHEPADKFSLVSVGPETNSNSVLKEKAKKGYYDNPEGSCSIITHFPSSSTESTSNDQSWLQSINNESELITNAVPARARPLTNKERLLLRRQALKTKNRPVLAVGKSNVVTGVAKAIRDHFKKYPLAIVNVKGRAKGTSVQEVVFELEQATGGILVSQEPSKIILYRGWGAGVDNGRVGHAKDVHDKRAGIPAPDVSPQLIEAMRLECGFSSD